MVYKKMEKKLKYALGGLALTLLSGCLNKIDEGYIVKKYTEGLRNTSLEMSNQTDPYLIKTLAPGGHLPPKELRVPYKKSPTTEYFFKVCEDMVRQSICEEFEVDKLTYDRYDVGNYYKH